MKLKCVKATKKVSCGFLWKESMTAKIEGLTEGKQYQGDAVTEVTGAYCDIEANSDFYFLIYNDDGEWSTYPLEFFVPADL